MNRYILFLAILFLSGCSTLSDFKDVEQKQDVAQAKVKEAESESVQASLDAIKIKNDALAIRFDEEAIALLGSPKSPIDVTKLKTVAQQDAFFKKYAKDNQTLVDDNNKLIQEKAQLEQQVEAEAKAQEASEWKATLWKWIMGSVGVLGLAGTICLIVFVPETLPLLGAILGTIFGALTRFISYLGSFFSSSTPS